MELNCPSDDSDSETESDHDVAVVPFILQGVDREDTPT